MRFDPQEKKALKFVLKKFDGDVYIFGSRLDYGATGGDIDILLKPNKKSKSLKLTLEIQTRFFSKCEEKIDVLVYENTPFFMEILKHAKKVDITGILGSKKRSPFA